MSDDVYAWRDVRFTLPAGLEDETVLTFRGANYSLTLTRDVLAGVALEDWARGQERAMAQQNLAAYVAEGPKLLDGVPAGMKALVVDRRFGDQSGQPVFQRQCFVALGGAVAIVTTTSREPASAKAKQAALALVQTLRPADR